MITATLQFGRGFRSAIETIRNEFTDDTNIIGWDNSFYRVCRANDEQARLVLLPRDGDHKRSVTCMLNLSNLYVTHIGKRGIEKYASTLIDKRLEIDVLDAALSTTRTDKGKKRFEQRSLIVFCVSESLRSSYIATEIDAMIQAATIGLRGRPAFSDVSNLWAQVHSWGAGSDAIFRVLSPEAQRLVLQPRVMLTPKERQFFERVDDQRIDAGLRTIARRITVLKRPK